MPNLFQWRKIINARYTFLILVLISAVASAQKIEIKSDLLLADSISQEKIPYVEKRPYIFKNEPKTFKNSNPASLLFGGSLYIYQNSISQHLSASCLFHPSCSDFGKQAVQEFGLVKGTFLSLDRLSRCNRIAATDLNPAEADREIHRFHDPVIHYK